MSRCELSYSWGDWLALSAWDVFGTLTLAATRDPHPEQLDKWFRSWLREVERLCDSKVVCVRAWEYQRRGVSHFHLLLYFSQCDVFPNYLLQRFGLAWKHGFSDFQVPRSFDSVSQYLSKYVVKGGAIDIFGRRRHVKLLLGGGARFGRARAARRASGTASSVK